MVRAQLCDVIIIATIEHGDTYETEAQLSWRRWDEVPERVDVTSAAAFVEGFIPVVRDRGDNSAP